MASEMPSKDREAIVNVVPAPVEDMDGLAGQGSNNKMEKEKDTTAYIQYQEADELNNSQDAAGAQAKLQIAREQDPGLPWKSKRGFQMAFLIFISCCCSGDTGYDSTVMSAVNSMSQYQNFFGMSSAGSATGIVFGIYTVGSLCACIPSAIIPDYLGRRWCMFIGNILLIIGAFLTSNAQNKNMFIGGRFLTGFGCGTASSGAKLYLAEFVPAHTRGRWIGLLNCFYYIGQILASGLTIATGRINSDYSWRIPMYIQAIPAFINLVFIMWFEESPRWSYARNHKDVAAKTLAKYHTRDNDVDSPIVKIELEEIHHSIAKTGSAKNLLDYTCLVRTRSDRYRTSMIIMIAILGQFSGNGLVTYFLPVLLEQAGITSSDRQRVLNFVNSITSMIGALLGTAIIDHFGRRKLLISGSAANAINMSIIAGLLSNSSSASNAQAQAGIAFVFWFMVCYSFGFTAIQAVYTTEVLTFEARAKGTAFAGVVVQAVSCLNTFIMPIALDKIESKTYIIFVIVDAIGFFVVMAFAPETKGYTLEELDKVFGAPNPVKYSTKSLVEARERRASGDL